MVQLQKKKKEQTKWNDTLEWNGKHNNRELFVHDMNFAQTHTQCRQ